MEQNKVQESKKPLRRKRKGFKHTKTGKYHNQDGGGGKGFKYGWPKSLSEGMTTGERAQCSPSTFEQNIEEALVSVPSVEPQCGVTGAVTCDENREKSSDPTQNQSKLSPTSNTPTRNISTSPRPSEEIAESIHFDIATCITPAAATSTSHTEVCREEYILEHSCSLHPKPNCVPMGDQSQPFVSVSKEIIATINDSLPRHWLCARKDTGINLFLMSRLKETAVERRLSVSPDVTTTFGVHRKPVRDSLFNSVFGASSPPVILSCENTCEFVQRVLRVVNTVRRYDAPYSV